MGKNDCNTIHLYASQDSSFGINDTGEKIPCPMQGLWVLLFSLKILLKECLMSYFAVRT